MPISLVLSLSRTINGLHWDKFPGDNDDEVGARGILYLLIFQQLGQLLRWSWGINVLLPKRIEPKKDGDDIDAKLERGQGGKFRLTADAEEGEESNRISGGQYDSHSVGEGSSDTINGEGEHSDCNTISSQSSQSVGSIEQIPAFKQRIWTQIYAGVKVFIQALWLSMNPPLFAMGIALIVASIPALQRLFFSDGTFVKNSITSAIRQSGGVAVPLILVVLGANLGSNSGLEDPAKSFADEHKVETKLVVASLISRMVLPTILIAPLLAVAAKFVPISILDDPIFVIVCFLLSGAPSALQLAQICQLNDVYMGAMTRILFHSYVVW